jgi:hypothetical protein
MRAKFYLSSAVSLCFGALFLLMTAPSYAVTTSHWIHQNQADFKAGTLHNVVVTNQGDVKLSRAIEVIQDQDPNVTTVNAMAQAPDGIVYAGTGPKAILLAIDGKKVSTVATIDNAVNILSVQIDSNGGILLGTGGEKGRVLRIAKPGDKPTELFSEDGVQYIWALRQTPDGNIYAATGPNGQVFEIKPDGTHRELYKSSEDNITSMISDGKDNLYLGTDPDGLVIRLDRKSGKPFIVYNAGETEITALALDSTGNLYASTGQVSDHQTAQQPEQPEKNAGRPENPNSSTPIPSNPSPKPPQPPQLPNPNPGEPKPIPKGHAMTSPALETPKMMSITTDGGDQPGGDQPGGNPDGPGDQPGPGQNPASPQPSAGRQNQPGNQPAPSNESTANEGNAIYKIDADGFVTEIFRENVVIYSMIMQGDVLLVGTGDDGDLYQVRPVAQETEVLAKVDAKQITCLLPVKDGQIFMGLANTGGISAMTGGYATNGNYLSPVLDATQVSRFGKIQLHGLLPNETKLQLATRSGNVKDADEPGWSDWSADTDAAEFQPVTSPSARFLQYRLSFKTGDSSQTALVDHVDVAYQIPNMAPVVKSIRIGADTSQSETNASDNANEPSPNTPPPIGRGADTAKTPGGSGAQTITWEASDPNNDSLTYSLYFRRQPQGPWILLKDRLTQTTFEWDTRTVTDGQYQVKIVASDALANPPGEGKTTSRVSDYYTVDNTPPSIGDMETTVIGTDANISFRVQDLTSTIASVEYAVDSNDQWQAVLPVDGIFDSLNEQVKFPLKDLSAGEHQVAIRATDVRGNQAMQSIVITIHSATAGNQ